MASLVDHGLALETLVALATETPDAIVTDLAESGASEPLGLVLVPIDQIDLAPTPSAAAIQTAILARALRARPLRYVGEYMYNELALLVEIVEAERFVQLDLTAQRARIALLVHPFDGEQLLLVELANLAEQVHELVEFDVVLDVDDHDDATIVDLDFDVIGRVGLLVLSLSPTDPTDSTAAAILVLSGRHLVMMMMIVTGEGG